MKDEPKADIDTTMRNRKIAMRRARNAAFRGDNIAGSLMALEQVAEPFYLGTDADEDDTDLDID